MHLFDPGPRTQFDFKQESESTFEYLNRSARPTVVVFRKMIEGWFDRFRAGGKEDLRKRFRSPKESNHTGAFFEIYLHELCSRLGFELDPHPEILGCSTHPDFVVKNRGANQFYLEAIIAGLPSQQEEGADARMGIVYDAINTIESPNFFLRLEIRGAPASAPPTQKLRHDLTAWLASLNPDDVLHLSSADLRTPRFIWQHEGWNLLFTPIPKSARLRGRPGVRPIGVRVPQGGWMNTHGEIRKAIEGKAKKYGELQLPFVVSVNVVGDHCDNIDILNALYGDESILVTQAIDGRLTERPSRKLNGAWLGRHGPRNLGVSAVLVFAGLSPWTMGVTTPELFHNPWARYPFPVSSWPLPYCFADLAEGRVRHEPGRVAREVLDLPCQWPLPENSSVE